MRKLFYIGMIIGAILGGISAIFLHCSIGKTTQGCVAIEKEKMKKLLKSINSIGNMHIIIR